MAFCRLCQKSFSFKGRVDKYYFVCIPCLRITKGKIRRNNERCKDKGKFRIYEWFDILLEHDFKCSACKVNKNMLTIEHKDDLSFGGKNKKDNITVFCERCNNKKSHINNKLFSKRSQLIIEGLVLKRKHKHLFSNLLEKKCA